MIGKQLLMLGNIQHRVDEALVRLSNDDFAHRIWAKDPVLWNAGPNAASRIITNLDWLSVLEMMKQRIGEITAFSQEIWRDAIENVVLLGVGGSSLAREVYLNTFGIGQGLPNLQVLESTIPASIRNIESQVDFTRTLFLMSSKSGHTLETNCLFRYFWDRASTALGNDVGRSFVAITTPQSSLARFALDKGFRRVFFFPPGIWGRFRALAHPGLVPASIIGIDVPLLIDRGVDMLRACGRDINVTRNPGIVLGVALAELVRAGRDKLTILASPSLRGLGYWVEQLLAESTGKEATGVVPIEGEPLPSSMIDGHNKPYADDRAFVYLKLISEGEYDIIAARLQQMGYPIIVLEIKTLANVLQELVRWGFAVMTVTALLGISPFDEPNFAQALTNTKRILFIKDKNVTQPDETDVNGGVSYPDISVQSLLAFLEQVRPGDYIGLQAYLEPTSANHEVLQAIRMTLMDAFAVATTLGYGPRFLHSTGQLHKGGSNKGLFIQITADLPYDIPIPEFNFTFGELTRALAIGDFQALTSDRRRVTNVHLSSNVEDDLRRLLHALRRIVMDDV
jgi:transaldolase/glucose-6-phosphate isomerase